LAAQPDISPPTPATPAISRVPEPIEQFFLKIADGGQLHVNGEIIEGKPAAKSAGHFASHQPAADNADAHLLFRHLAD
jgi:hypothetical protein